MSSVQNYTHILNINVENVNDNMVSMIHDTIHNQMIHKNISDTNISIKWYSNNESISDVLTYYTDVKGMLGDRAVQLHTKMVLRDIRKYINADELHFTVTKPLVKLKCML